MELHESLYALGRSQGRELFSDADSFRGALDDYLDEESATTGDINLLVDAVRLGAFQSMVTMLDSGADADRAIAEAGNRLARDRGSADVGGSTWALAVLGYAIGKVSDAQVRSYRTQHGSSPVPPPAGPPTMLPQTGPTPPVSSPATPHSPTTPPPPAATSPVWPAQQPPQPAGYGQAPAHPGTPYGGYAGPPGPVLPAGHGGPAGPAGHAGPRKPRKIWPAIVAAVVVIALLGGGATAFLVFRGDEEPDEPTKDPTSEGPDVSFEALNSRYASLGQMVTSGMDECAAADTASGEAEVVECTFPNGTLALTTYTSAAELDAARKRRLDVAKGTTVSDLDSGVYYRFDPKVADDTSTAPPVLYWDSRAGVQSAEMTGGTGVTADNLDTAFDAVSATVTPPDGPADTQLVEFVNQFAVVGCERIPVLVDGETEESKCKRSGRNTWVGHFAKAKDLRQYRQNAKSLAGQDGDLVVDYWYTDENSNGIQDAEEPEQGKIYGYIEDDSDYGVLYLDDLDCKCYLQMYDRGEGDPEKLYNLIF
ncbi:hypothetical protein [Nocardioides sp. TF02-7]|uniref:hypothetical protein n=1 Tax=Nocardioides sp. TF02-7 TaxID=2917724 RepID=UPI001F058888|nr:hypothetical protein [Nocardioides sp. TF02-7]UMG91784.1 hypothetical protein MF408_17250 [Nocardioides sp. TF02-7]